MLAYLPFVLFISLGWFLRDPVSLFASTILSIYVLVVAVMQKEQRWIRGVGQGCLFGLFGIYLVSSLFNSLSISEAVQAEFWTFFLALFSNRFWFGKFRASKG